MGLVTSRPQRAGGKSIFLGLFPTVASTTVVAPVPGATVSTNPGSQAQSLSPDSLQTQTQVWGSRGMPEKRVLSFLWHWPCSTSCHCSIQCPSDSDMPRRLMISWCFQWASVSVTAYWGFHFLPHLVLLACLTFPSSDKRSVLTALALVALNSSNPDEADKESLGALLYRLTGLKDAGTPSHFQAKICCTVSPLLRLHDFSDLKCTQDPSWICFCLLCFQQID